jgi:hypothetical protein
MFHPDNLFFDDKRYLNFITCRNSTRSLNLERFTIHLFVEIELFLISLERFNTQTLHWAGNAYQGQTMTQLGLKEITGL